jgi:hypothetical protein
VGPLKGAGLGAERAGGNGGIRPIFPLKNARGSRVARETTKKKMKAAIATFKLYSKLGVGGGGGSARKSRPLISLKGWGGTL